MALQRFQKRAKETEVSGATPPDAPPKASISAALTSLYL